MYSDGFYEIFRSKEGTYVTVELDNGLEAGFSFLVLGGVLIAAIASVLGIIGGRHRVRVAVMIGGGSQVTSRGFKSKTDAIESAQSLMAEIKEVGLDSIGRWKQAGPTRDRRP